MMPSINKEERENFYSEIADAKFKAIIIFQVHVVLADTALTKGFSSSYMTI